jgi:hypothetical protein
MSGSEPFKAAVTSEAVPSGMARRVKWSPAMQVCGFDELSAA